VLSEAAGLFRESGVAWSDLAARAAEATAGLGEYTELCEERVLLLLTRGRDAAPELRALSAKINEMTDGYDDALGDDGRSTLFAELADLVDVARERESRAVELLSTILPASGGPAINSR
jgi:hypothetical protein